VTGREIAPITGPATDASDALARFDRDASAVASSRADDLADELLERETRSRRFAWIITGILIVICAAQAAAIAVMLPLKEVVPYTIVVDRSSGFVEAVRTVELGALPEDEAVTQALLAQYVIARETFDAADIASRYKLVALWSAERARDDYVASYRADNPVNLVATNAAGTVRRVNVRAVQLIDRASTPKRASVDFEVRESAPGMLERVSVHRAQIGFRYSGAPMRNEDRLQNPLGFQVTTYRRDDAAPLAVVAPAEFPPGLAIAGDPESPLTEALPEPPPLATTPRPSVLTIEPQP
jgi:type IV secretion system protein VirB8